jgi:hypothetical protein
VYAGPGLIIAAVVAVAALLIYANVVQKRKRREAFLLLSTKLGLRYDIDDPFDTVDLPFDLFHRGNRQSVFNMLSGDASGIRVRLFDYEYVVYSTDAQGHSTSSTYRFSCALGEIDADCPHLVVEHESLLSGLSRHLGFHDIEFESEEFNKAFKIQSDEKKFAFAMIDARMMQWLLDEGGACNYEVIGPLVLCYHNRVKPAEYENMFEVLRRFHAHVPSVVASMYPRGKEAHA